MNPNAVQTLEDDRLAYNYCCQVYIDNECQLFDRPSKWEKSGWLRHLNYIILFTIRVYRTEEMMVRAASAMAAARTERALPQQQFLIPPPKENSWGNLRVLDKKNIVRAFVGVTPEMNKRKDEECMTAFLDATVVNGVQDPGITPIEEFLPRSAPLVDFLSIGLHSGAGWKYPSHKLIHGIQQNRGLSFQMLKEIEVKEIIAGVSSAEKISEINL